jgi:hypothetical protein
MVLLYLKGLVIIKCSFFYLYLLIYCVFGICGDYICDQLRFIKSGIRGRATPYKKYMQDIIYYYQTLEVGKHHTMDPIMKGILSCSLASLRGHPPIELPLQIQSFLHIPLHYLNLFI